MTIGRPKRAITIKLSFTEAEALAVMTSAMHSDLPPAVFCRRAVRKYMEFMGTNSSHPRGGSNANSSPFELPEDTDEDDERTDDGPTDFQEPIELKAVR